MKTFSYQKKCTNFACASSRLWSVMVMIWCRMSPMSCFLPSPSVPSCPWGGGRAMPPCTEWPARLTPPRACMIRACSSIVRRNTINALVLSHWDGWKKLGECTCKNNLIISCAVFNGSLSCTKYWPWSDAANTINRWMKYSGIDVPGTTLWKNI